MPLKKALGAELWQCPVGISIGKTVGASARAATLSQPQITLFISNSSKTRKKLFASMTKQDADLIQPATNC